MILNNNLAKEFFIKIKFKTSPDSSGNTFYEVTNKKIATDSRISF